jgi:hypothetical protein
MAARKADGAAELLRRWRKAKEGRAVWEGHWRECCDYAMPQRAFEADRTPGAKRTEKLFDGTAPDAVDQLAASLLAQLTPPWSPWFQLEPGGEVEPGLRSELAKPLAEAAEQLKAQLDHSNFAVEIHQCYLDLVTLGTASLLFEEAEPGEPSAFRFAAVPMAEAVLEEGPEGKLDATFRRAELTLAQLERRFPEAAVPDELRRAAEQEPERRFGVVEAVLPDGAAYRWSAALEDGPGEAGALLAEGRFGQSPFINFRWLKAPGEVYGRSPVMKALPDIKTANKVVELVLKNASIAVAGIWQADDDGVLNPANVRLVPGAIIPKAVGSAGLTPLEAPGRFDISQLMLDDLRARIRHALLVDKLGQIADPRMTATEVLERSSEMSRLIGAAFGRLQAELLGPLVRRAIAILRRRGELPDFALDGREVGLRFTSPLARVQSQGELAGALQWLQQAAALGPEALAVIDAAEAARWLGRALGAPERLMRPATEAADA